MNKWKRIGATLIAGATLVALCWVLPGCFNSIGLNVPSHVDIVGDPIPDPRGGTPITMVLVEQGAMAFGLPCLEVDGQGQAVFRYRRYEMGSSGRYESKFTLTADELVALHGLIEEIGYSKMSDAYHPRLRVLDGEVCTFIVVREGQAKKVFCNNAFPRGLWRLKEMAFKTLPDAHARKIEESKQETGA